MSQWILGTVPDGWPIGSYDSYNEAQQTVDHLAGEQFPVQGLTIVGIDPMLVERVHTRLTWRRVVSGTAFGLVSAAARYAPTRGLLAARLLRDG